MEGMHRRSRWHGSPTGVGKPVNDRRTKSRFVQRCEKLRTRPYRAETHCGRGKIRFSAQLVRYNFSGNENEILELNPPPIFSILAVTTAN